MDFQFSTSFSVVYCYNYPPLKIVDLIDFSDVERRWHQQRIREILGSTWLSHILQIQLGGQDLLCWNEEPAGTCSLKAIYKTIGPHYPWKTLWSLPIQSNLKLFTWRNLLQKLPSHSYLNDILPNITTVCVISRRPWRPLIICSPFVLSQDKFG